MRSARCIFFSPFFLLDAARVWLYLDLEYYGNTPRKYRARFAITLSFSVVLWDTAHTYTCSAEEFTGKCYSSRFFPRSCLLGSPPFFTWAITSSFFAAIFTIFPNFILRKYVPSWDIVFKPPNWHFTLNNFWKKFSISKNWNSWKNFKEEIFFIRSKRFDVGGK